MFGDPHGEAMAYQRLKRERESFGNPAPKANDIPPSSAEAEAERRERRARNERRGDGGGSVRPS